MLGRWAAFATACVTIVACSRSNDAERSDAPLNAIAAGLAEGPWEILSNKGETYLPNVFYADASQNQQLMPYALDGHVMIDRLIYPTLGNPNLYTRSDAEDELTVVLRLENTSAASLSFSLVPHAKRAAGDGGIAITPDAVTVKEEPADMPAVLKQRHTVRATFGQAAMKGVPPGLYDVHFTQGATSEYQYNAVQVYATEPDDYDIINVTDTQVAVGSSYGKETRDKLDQFVAYVNASTDPKVRDAAFITFNGDLHNGGSPAGLTESVVATQYSDEAKAIVAALKQLTKPIFLTAGNHDGFVNTGQVPAAISTLSFVTGATLHDVLSSVASPWPNLDLNAYEQWLAATRAQDQLGGAHRDLFGGTFARTAKIEGFAGWKEIPNRNYLLYDGFYQWQKTYGPLYFSWRFGKNAYLSLNSFELRQHKRAGWGMYTVNYGGGVSDTQVKWVDRELARAKVEVTDVVVLAHHDPRGGHTGHDRGYYFEQLDYQSIYQSSINYISAIYLDPKVCKLPAWALTSGQEQSCLHDGLQEWMRPDTELDCDWDQRNPDFTCKQGAAIWTSGTELMKRLSESDQVRTLLLGHTHYNELEILQAGDPLLPATLPTDSASVARFATLEVTNPFRGFAVQQKVYLPLNDFVPQAAPDYDNTVLPLAPLEATYASFATGYSAAVSGWSRTLAPAATGPRELVVLRLVSNSDLADQTSSNGKSAMGFSVLELGQHADLRNFSKPQVNRAHFFINDGSGNFTRYTTIDIDRTARLAAHDGQNPIQRAYSW